MDLLLAWCVHRTVISILASVYSMQSQKQYYICSTCCQENRCKVCENHRHLCKFSLCLCLGLLQAGVIPWNLRGICTIGISIATTNRISALRMEIMYYSACPLCSIGIECTGHYLECILTMQSTSGRNKGEQRYLWESQCKGNYRIVVSWTTWTMSLPQLSLLKDCSTANHPPTYQDPLVKCQLALFQKAHVRVHPPPPYFGGHFLSQNPCHWSTWPQAILFHSAQVAKQLCEIVCFKVDT